MSKKLEGYSLIGDSCAAALVNKDGSIDWCCLPDFDSPSIFSAILDEEKGGFFSICPVSYCHSSQNYITDTNVLETHFDTQSGVICLTDAFSVQDEGQKKKSLYADHELMRIVECLAGNVSVQIDFEPRLFYGKKKPRFKQHKKLGIRFVWKEHIFILQSSLPYDQFQINKDEAKISLIFSLEQGERALFSLSYSCQNPAIIPELKITGSGRMAETIQYWKGWIGNCSYTGFSKIQIRRSLLALKLLEHAPSGAIVAASTASLPEEIGGDKNWDYRYCWLRDASFTVRILVRLGYEKEAGAFLNWILHATQLTRPRVQIVYSIYGRSNIKEKELGWLKGYRGSKPVRIGNEARRQTQLDVYGEVIDAFFAYSPLVSKFDRSTRNFLIGLGKTICKIWKLPDNGIWEERGSFRHYTHSKVLAWAGLDRLIKLAEKYRWKDAPVEKFQQAAADIRDSIERFAYNKELQSYTKVFNDSALDAALLTLSLVDYCDADAERMSSTMQAISKQLSKDKLIYRYEDSINGGEASFGICTFWYIENLAKAGKVAEAVEYFENLLQYANPTGLLSEEMDSDWKELIGNYPQGFSHVGLINAALSIQEAMDKQKN